MISILIATFFNDKNYNAQKQFYFAAFLILFSVVAIGIDSTCFLTNYFDGKPITNCIVFIYFSFFFYFSDSNLRKLMFVMVFLSCLGEHIFCGLLEMYHYRSPGIPLYIPFGHSIVYASGYVFAHKEWAIKNDDVLKKYFAIGFSILFLFVGLILQDILSLIFGAFFFLLLKRKKWKTRYWFMAFSAVALELIGTYYQSWKWVPKAFGSIPTINPPIGAVFIYLGGDVLLEKIVGYRKSSTNESTTKPIKVDNQLDNLSLDKNKH